MSSPNPYPFPSSSVRRRRNPLHPATGFFTPPDLTGLPLIHALVSLAESLSPPAAVLPFQRRNARALSRRALTLLSLFEHLRSSPPSRLLLLPPPASLCLKELYIHLFRSKALLDYCSQSSRLFLLLLNPKLSALFHDLSVEASTLLDVLPLHDLSLPRDLLDHLLLLRRLRPQFLDPRDESLRLQFLSFLRQFHSGLLPDPDLLRHAFVHCLRIPDAASCRLEIESLEDQIPSLDDDADAALLDSALALARYSRFALFGFSPDPDRPPPLLKSRTPSVRRIADDALVAVPREFCCPISLEMMRDPVTVSTGQTYDRISIARWIEEGHNSCPNSGLTLMHKRVVPNRALRCLIAQWCANVGVLYDPPVTVDVPGDGVAVAAPSRAAAEANRATVDLLMNRLRVGTEEEKTVVARELRLLAKTGKENRVYIAESGAIPLLKGLLLSTNEVAQENSVTAILNLSIHDKNKSKVVEVEGCLTSIVGVLRHGWTVEARENAAAVLFSLSAVHEYKKMIGNEEGALEALAGLLGNGTPRGRRDAVTALFNLSTHPDCSERMIVSGAASALVDALETEGVVEEAAGALGLLLRRPAVANSVAKDGKAVAALVGLLREGSPKAKENAAAALAEMCRSGGAEVTEIVASIPSVTALIQMLLFSGTKRAKRKAASLARAFQRFKVVDHIPGRLPRVISLAESQYLRGGSGFNNRDVSQVSGLDSSFNGADVSDVSVSVPVPMSVHVL